MEDDQKFYARDIQTDHIIGGSTSAFRVSKLANRFSRIIRAAATDCDSGNKVIVGGDSDDDEHMTPPSIVIEKRDDMITKILVQCPCGRHAELICEYDAE